MPFENLSNGAALWVDVVWSKERPLGLGAARFVALMRDQRALESELAGFADFLVDSASRSCLCSY